MRRILISLLVLLVGLAAFLVPLPLLVLAPGGALSVAERVAFPTRVEDDPSGRLLLTTVAVQPATAARAVAAWADPDADVIDRNRVIPAGTDSEEYFEAQRRLFEESGRIAAAVGLRAAGLDVSVSGRGARVTGVVPGAPAAGKLSTGEVITAVAGAPMQTAADLVTAIAKKEAGREVDLTVERDGRTRQVRIELGRYGEGDQVGLGVRVDTRDLRIDLPFPVEVDAGRLGGPSAGLMIALTVYDLAERGDLTAGRVIAGTGTVDLDGDVGPVGGVRQKVEAALDAGARLFLAPPAEATEARAAAGDRLRVVEASTVQEALDALAETDE